MVNIRVIKPHVQNNGDCFMLTEGKEFAIVFGKQCSLKFTETDADTLVKVITSFNAAKVVKKIKLGRQLANNENMLVIPCENSTFDNYQFMTVEITSQNISVWKTKIFTNDRVIELPVGMVDDIMKYLKSQGCEPAITFGTYNDIRFVDSIPENPTAGVAYVLTKDDGERDAGNAYMFNGRRLEIVSDTPIEADPEDPATIPDSLVKEEAPQTVGGASEQTAEVWDKAISAKTTVEAAESVSIVNSTLTDGSIAVTIA